MDSNIKEQWMSPKPQKFREVLLKFVISMIVVRRRDDVRKKQYAEQWKKY